MGATLDTLAPCPLCEQQTSKLVRLKCKHQFCQRCIEDLWSTTPDGPYHCPESRCKMVYKTLPFNRTSSSRQSPSSRRSVQLRNTAGQLLGKRKACASAADQPATKRSTVEAPPEQSGDVEGPSSSSSYSAGPVKVPPEQSGDIEGGSSSSSHSAGPVKVPPEQSGDVEGGSSSSSHSAGLVKVPPEQSGDVEVSRSSSSDLAGPMKAPPEQSGDVEVSRSSFSDSAGPALPQKSESQEYGHGMSFSVISVNSESSDVANNISGQQGVPESAAIVILDDDDSLDETILFEAPPAASPQRGAAEDPASPAIAGSSAGACPDKTKPPFISTAHLASTSGSPSFFGSFPGAEGKRASPVPCDCCPKMLYQPAVKTCLVCEASMCSEHLRPHLDSPAFQNHTLIPLVKDISFCKCQEHHEMNRIYCRQCAVCICALCTIIGSHRGHKCISIKEAVTELRGNLIKEIAQLQQTEAQVNIRLEELDMKKDASRVVLDEARMSVQQQYAAIKEAMDEEEQMALHCVKREESRVLGGLEEKLGHLGSVLQSIQRRLHTLEGLADANRDKNIADQAFIMDYSKTARIADAIGSYVEQFEAPEEVDQARLKCLQSWMEKRLDSVVITVLGKGREGYRLLYGCVPSLDANTAHPKLQLSDNNTGVTYSDTQQSYTDHVARFNSFPQVLASCALQGGHWYWEVMVSMDEGRWKVGVCEGQIERKGQEDSSRLGCNPYSWCLVYDRKKVEALHNKVSEPVDVDGLQKVGVFLNFEEGVLSFFNVTTGGSLALMHSFKHSFSDPVYPAFSVSKTHLAICDLYHC